MSLRFPAVFLGFAAILGLAAQASAQTFLNPPADAAKPAIPAATPDAARPAPDATKPDVSKDVKPGDVSAPKVASKPEVKIERAVFGGGCFWCMEAVFERIKGIKNVVSGYAGGDLARPSYEAVCTGLTGHAEVIEVDFDPTIITYRELIDLFWLAHDPTTLNRQGPDSGTQYRSVIFYVDEAQKKAAFESYQKASSDRLYSSPIVTDLVPLVRFWPADSHHQNYYQKNAKSNPYCSAVIAPKLREFKHKLDVVATMREKEKAAAAAQSQPK